MPVFDNIKATFNIFKFCLMANCDVMNKDAFGRQINYLRVSVTDKCNLNCRYCKPKAYYKQKGKRDILSFEEITHIVKAATRIGIRKVRLTGGEPFARYGLIQLIKQLNELELLEELNVTTNAVLLGHIIPELANLKLAGINISLDTLDKKKFHELTGFDGLFTVLNNMEQLKSYGIEIKINVVGLKNINDNEIIDLVKFAHRMDVPIRFIELFPIKVLNNEHSKFYLSAKEIENKLRDHYKLSIIENKVKSSGPARYFFIDKSFKVGIISSVSNKFCSNCNRLRLTSDGLIKPCLFGKQTVDVKKVLRNTLLDEENKLQKLQDKFKEAMRQKPKELINYDLNSLASIGG